MIIGITKMKGLIIMKISILLLVGAWGGDPTLQTDTEALVQIFFALGGPGWQNRNGWEKIEVARDQFDDVFDSNGDEILSPVELKRGLNVNYVGCQDPPCYPFLNVQNPLFRIPYPNNSFALKEYGFCVFGEPLCNADNERDILPLIVTAQRARTDPSRLESKVAGRNKALDGFVMFKEFFSNFAASDPCLDNWFGVSCSDQGRVIGLSLNSNQLTGKIPPDIGNLTQLRGLSLGSNDLSGLNPNYIIGGIPDEIQQLYLLQTLSLEYNMLTGTIPRSVGLLSSLTRLDLSFNRFEGPLPDITGLKNLHLLNVNHNRLNGSVSMLNSLQLLVHADLSYNNFTGDLQTPFRFCKLLRSLFIHGNTYSAAPLPLGDARFAGEVEQVNAGMLSQDKSALLDFYQTAGGRHWLFRRGWDMPESDPCLSYWFGVFCDDRGRAVALELSQNNVSGIFPRSIGQLVNLKSLRLSGNWIRGTIPVELVALPHLRALDLSGNLLSGPIPDQVANSIELEELDLSNNYLKGPIPAPTAPRGLVRLRQMLLSRNRLSGFVGNWVGSISGLEILDLRINRLSGPLPPTLGLIRTLQTVAMSFNALQGPLPKEWGSLSRLTSLDLAGNMLSGPIPDSWGGGMSRIRVLNLNSNRLHGSLPATLGALPMLEVLSLADNLVSGVLPPALTALNRTLLILNVSGNRLEGPMPSSLAHLDKLAALDLSSNLFSGFLPDYFSIRPHFQAMGDGLRLGGNDFACPIPENPVTTISGASCTSRNCPLGWVSDGKSCYQCRPGYHRCFNV